MPVPLVFGQWQPMFFWAECAQALLPGVCTSAPRPPEGSESMQRVETGTEQVREAGFKSGLCWSPACDPGPFNQPYKSQILHQ